MNRSISRMWVIIERILIVSVGQIVVAVVVVEVVVFEQTTTSKGQYNWGSNTTQGWEQTTTNWKQAYKQLFLMVMS